jgi:ferredoxin
MPVDSSTGGIFLAGACQGVKDIPETVAQASAAASKVMQLFSRQELWREPEVAIVDQKHCMNCWDCVTVCPYNAIEREEKNGSPRQFLEMGCKGESRVIFGVRPCDAASIGSLNAVFSSANAGFDDPFFTKRRENTTIVTYSCTEPDESCFCTSVGLTPDGDRGSDLHLTEIANNRLHVEIKTPAGEAVAKIIEPLFQGTGDEEARLRAGKEVQKKMKRIRNSHLIKGWLDDLNNFDDEMWARLGEKCIGCGACTFMCPTCHCFDIVDETRGRKGYRVKFWDACQFDHFTLHASGHNPRDSQYKRYRNRFTCKFEIYWDKFNAQSCVGCGRCIRDCPVNLDITEYMMEVDLKASMPNALERDPDFE